MKRYAIMFFLAMCQCFSVTAMYQYQRPQIPLSCCNRCYALPVLGDLSKQTGELAGILQKLDNSDKSNESKNAIAQLITENNNMNEIIGTDGKCNAEFITCMGDTLLSTYLDVISEDLPCEPGICAILTYAMDAQKFGPQEKIWFVPIAFARKLNDLVCEKSLLCDGKHKKFEQDIVNDINYLKTQISMMQYFIAPCSMAAIGNRFDKFIPTGKTWTKHSINCWSLTLDIHTYKITASSVYRGTDNFAPQNLFNGQSETSAPNYNTWITIDGAKSGELLLQITPAERFDCLYMQTRSYVLLQGPKDFNIIGMSNETSSGDEIAKFGNIHWTASEEKVFPLGVTKAYEFYKFQFLNSESGDFISIAQLNFGIFK